MNDISLKPILDKVGFILHRFHVIIFTIIVIGGLAFIIFILSSLVSSTSDISSFSGNTDTSLRGFDKETIKRLDELRGNNETPEELSFPYARKSPFVE